MLFAVVQGMDFAAAEMNGTEPGVLYKQVSMRDLHDYTD
jgi:hypothetical protein